MLKWLVVCPLVLMLGMGDSAFSQSSVAPGSGPTPVANKVASGPPPANTLQDGTAIKLRLTENLTSATAKAGQQVAFETFEETDVDGVMVIAKGAPAPATVTTAEPCKSMGRAGKLDVNIDSVRLLRYRSSFTEKTLRFRRGRRSRRLSLAT